MTGWDSTYFHHWMNDKTILRGGNGFIITNAQIWRWMAIHQYNIYNEWPDSTYNLG